MSRLHPTFDEQRRHGCRRIGAGLMVLVGSVLGGVGVLGAAPADAAGTGPTDAGYCGTHGAALTGWSGTSPNLPICGPGPAYGGSEAWVNIPGPYGSGGTYYNATDGFQCVELAERFLAVVAGLAPVKANGSSVAENYHAAYPSTTLIVNGSPQAIGHPPASGDVISFSAGPDFGDDGDGHVAVVVSSTVNGAGDGDVVIAQENVASSDYVRTLDLQSWRLLDPEEPPNAEYQFPYAEWLIVPSSHPAIDSLGANAVVPRLLRTTPAVTATLGAASVLVAETSHFRKVSSVGLRPDMRRHLLVRKA